MVLDKDKSFNPLLVKNLTVKFKRFLNLMDKEYVRHHNLKKDSWRDMSIYDLKNLMRRVSSEYWVSVHTGETDLEQLDKLVDYGLCVIILGEVMYFKTQGLYKE